jgi:hypothetical protein
MKSSKAKLLVPGPTASDPGTWTQSSVFFIIPFAWKKLSIKIYQLNVVKFFLPIESGMKREAGKSLVCVIKDERYRLQCEAYIMLICN